MTEPSELVPRHPRVCDERIHAPHAPCGKSAPARRRLVAASRPLSPAASSCSRTSAYAAVAAGDPGSVRPLCDGLALVAARASHKSWWRNFRGPARVTITVRRRQQRAVADVLRSDERNVGLAAFRARYPRVRLEDDFEVVRMRLERSGLASVLSGAAVGGAPGCERARVTRTWPHAPGPHPDATRHRG